MSIVDILQSEATLTAGVSILGTVWTLFKSSDWLQARKRRRLREALKALEAAVEATYREYVRAWKEKNPDGRLTQEEQAAARLSTLGNAPSPSQRRGASTWYGGWGRISSTSGQAGSSGD